MGQRPLEGIRVLDLGRFLAAPWCGQMLGDLGAEVIKVERPGSGDQFRGYGPPFMQDAAGRDTAESSYFLCANRNKKSVTANLATEGGRAVVRALAARCDVLIENFKVGDLARAGLDYASLSTVNPGLIYCSVTGFGQTGPFADRPGLDSVFQALGGLMSVTGEPDGPPQKVGVTIIDYITGLYATVAVMGALRHREVQGGAGQHIDMALLDTAVATMTHRAQDYLLTGEVPRRSGTSTLGSAPAQVFRCRDGEINIQAGDDQPFKRLCARLGLEALAREDHFRTRADRWRNRATLLPPLAAAIRQRTVDELHDALSADGIVNAPIYSFDQTLAHPQVRHRGLVREIDHPLGTTQILANPIRFGATPLDDYAPPPLLGEHTQSVLGDLLGMDAQEIESLRESGAI